MSIKNKLHDVQLYFFNIFIILTYILIIVSALGLSTTASTYLENMDFYIRIYICLFLIWRFNPLRTHYEFTDLDRKIAFSAGLFILTTTVLYNYLDDIKNKTTQILKK